MDLTTQLKQAKTEQFVALILDNEVTVGEFVTEPPLPWTRIVQHDGIFQFAKGYPNFLTAEQGTFEMKNWDAVSLAGIMRTLAQLNDAVDYVVIGNNAGQGLPLAQAVPEKLRPTQAGIIFASSLPQQRAYEQQGYQSFYRRREAAARLAALAERSNRSLALYFMNTIQHNDLNYHDP
jgi:hypothetical protein